jgi:signal transduction histidine kinase
VELAIRGEVRPLPTTVELNAYRIVQEALTNSLKHGGRRGATVTLEYLDEALRVEVCDLGGVPPEGPPPNSSGYGLISMQTRAAMLGGRLEAGRADRGFRVAVELPLAGVPA